MGNVRHGENGLPSRWQQYLEVLEAKGVPQHAQQRYIARLEAFLRERRHPLPP
jgi:hypothetical protein